MSINIGDNFSYLGKKFLDDREHFDTVAKMKACNDVPNGFITFCDETNTRYEYHVDNEVDTTLGKWRVFTSVPDVNFDEYVTQDELEEAIKDVDVTTQLENYATKEYVEEAIKDVDVTEQLQDYAKKSDIPSVPTKVSQLENDKGYLTEHQDISHLVTQEEFNELELIETSPTEPTDEDVVIWINTSEDTPTDVLARINDDTVANNTTWSSSKINNTLNNLQLEGGNGGNGGNIDLNDYALKTELHSHNNKSVLDNITSDKITSWDNKSTFSGNYNDLTNKPTIPTVPTKTSQLTNDSNFLTSIPSEYITESELSTKQYATESYVQTAIDNAQLSGGDGETVDMTKYALKSDVPTKTSQLSNDSNFLTSVPSEYITDSELNAKGYLTEHQSLENYALKTDIPSVPTKTSELTNDSNFLTSIPSEYVTDSELNAKGYLTEHQSLTDYAKKSELHNHDNKSVLDGITSAKVSSWDNKSTFDGNYNSLTNKPTIPTVTNDLTNTLKSNYDTAYNHSQSSHAPSNAQKNSDITKTEIETKLTGDITSHTHSQYLTEHQSLTDYAKKTDIPSVPTKTSELTNDSNFLTSVPSEYITETELNNRGYLTSVPNEYITDTELNNRGYLTSVPSEYITDTELNNKGYLTSVPSEYITDTELNNKGYATTSQIPTSLPANGGNANTVGGYTIWTGTQAQYDAIATKSNTTLYFIKEG